jgi:uncharacterized membrane protein
VEPTAAATRGTIDEVEGPIASASEIQIDAPAEEVWRTITDFRRWPEWNPEVKSMSVEPGDVAEGLVFRWKAGPGQITSTVAYAVAPKRIAWTGKTIGIDALHVWRIEARGDRTFVHTEEAFRGLLARLLRRPMRRTLDGALDRGLVALKREAERRPAGEDEA